MKTVLIYDQCGEVELKFAVVDGDWSEFDRVYINTYGSEKADELLEKLYPPEDETGEITIDLLNEFPHQAVIDGAKVIVCGFLP